MLTAVKRTELINHIEELPALLEKAVEGLDDQQLNTPYREGGWTLRQVTHHIADSHMNAFIRMKLIITENNPTLKPYDQDDWAELPDARNFTVQSSLNIIRGVHQRMTHLLRTTHETNWGRTAYHPENGEMSLEDVLQNYATHGQNHVEQILTLRKQRGW